MPLTGAHAFKEIRWFVRQRGSSYVQHDAASE
jgi:hypothetical protein